MCVKYFALLHILVILISSFNYINTCKILISSLTTLIPVKYFAPLVIVKYI